MASGAARPARITIGRLVSMRVMSYGVRVDRWGLSSSSKGSSSRWWMCRLSAVSTYHSMNRKNVKKDEGDHGIDVDPPIVSR